ncbi:EDRF1-like protein [Mya arenaria]|uniref:EDRF1-like protein n=1 Tax=Mya arenaria TaxID=6604 RepID=A0ABY7FJD1_MYAAR|nr:EDRF1-like protein [Mya arenaria]
MSDDIDNKDRQLVPVDQKNDKSIVPYHGVRSMAEVKHGIVHFESPFSQLSLNTDLNIPPSNWLRTSSKLEQHIPFEKSHVSMMVHRVGKTLLLDEFDIHKQLLRTEQMKCVPRPSKRRDSLQNRNIVCDTESDVSVAATNRMLTRDDLSLIPDPLPKQYEIIKTEDIPDLENSKFDPQSVCTSASYLLSDLYVPDSSLDDDWSLPGSSSEENSDEESQQCNSDEAIPLHYEPIRKNEKNANKNTKTHTADPDTKYEVKVDLDLQMTSVTPDSALKVILPHKAEENDALLSSLYGLLGDARLGLLKTGLLPVDWPVIWKTSPPEECAILEMTEKEFETFDLQEKSLTGMQTTWDQASQALKEGIGVFECIEDKANQALLHCNLGRLMRLIAQTYTNTVQIGNKQEFTPLEREYYNKLVKVYKQINSRKSGKEASSKADDMKKLYAASLGHGKADSDSATVISRCKFLLTVLTQVTCFYQEVLQKDLEVRHSLMC